MGVKPKISPRGTYVLDAGDLEKLDELSLTSVIGEVRDALEQSPGEPAGDGIDNASSAGDPTINGLLGGGIDPPTDRRWDACSEIPEYAAIEAADEFIAPELLFREEGSGSDDDVS